MGIFRVASYPRLEIDTPVATLPDARRYSVSAQTGRPGVTILWLGEMESLICNFYISVAARTTVWTDPSLRITSMLLGRSEPNKQTDDIMQNGASDKAVHGIYGS